MPPEAAAQVVEKVEEKVEEKVDRGDELEAVKAKEPDQLEQAAKIGDEADEAEETAEEKAEREAEEKKKRARIPLARHEEILGKARAREEELLKELESLKGTQQATDVQKIITDAHAKIGELQDKYEDLILDGEKEEARKVRKQIDTMRDQLIDYQSSVRADMARQAAVEELTYKAELASAEARYPALNPEHEAFDEARTTEVAQLVNAFLQAGEARAVALSKAVKYVLGPPPSSKADADKDASAAAHKRAEDARKKAADADAKQPPSTAKVGIDSDKGGTSTAGIDVMRLSQEKFAKLDEEALSKLRGDVL